MRSFHTARAAAVFTAALILLAGAPACAGEGDAQPYHLPAQPLAQSLRAVGAASGTDIVAPAQLVEGRTAPRLDGDYTPDAAVAALLVGSGLRATHVGDGLVISSASGEAPASPAGEGSSTEIFVTGSRIRGGPVASPVIRVDRAEIDNSGYGDLGQVVRAIPQSFGGGQNPGIGTNVPAANGVDVGGGSSIDLRGIGSDATLTLLNGHRLSYSSSRQSVDVSAIPLAAVERIEIVADGSSALYGSDAVAGVANIILRRRVSGLETSARIGSSTDGGYFQQTYGVLDGADWSSGGVVAAYEYGSNSPIVASDRSYAADRSPGLTLFPRLGHHSALVNAHQALAGGLELSVDALYNRRTSDSYFPLNFDGDLYLSSGRLYGTTESFAVTPSLRLALGSGWRLTATASYGADKVDFAADLFFSGTKEPGGAGYYRNSARSIEVGADGSLFDLPGGAARLAVGAGFRSIGFSVSKGEGSFQNFSRSQDNYFAYGEVDLPLVPSRGKAASGPLLDLTAAARYENYPGIGEVTTPKLGVIVAPSADVSVKGSWGKAFRAPTLLQQYAPSSVALYPASRLGGAGYPATATVLLVQGGNPGLAPERARTWSATLDLHPRALAGIRAELSYFSLRYRDRIVTPIGTTAVALSNPIYSDLVTLDPSDSAKAATIANAGTFFNVSGASYDPASVVAIIDNSNVNAGYQRLSGVDVLLSYDRDFGPKAGSLGLMLNGSYLDSEQRLGPGQPIVALAGTLFNPPHVRGRGMLTWSLGPVTASGAVNYQGPVEDRRFAPVARIAAVTTVDFTLRLSTGERRGTLDNLEVGLSILNAFNAKPTPIRTTLYTDTPYDSTSYSPIGRFIGVEVRKTW
jgi:outer membrane receptor protein involved in Fe transport